MLNLPSLDVVAEFEAPPEAFWVTFSPDGASAAIAGEAGVEILRIADGTRTHLSGEPGFLVAIGPDGLVAAEQPEGVVVWQPPYRSPGPLLPAPWVLSLAFHPHEPILAMAVPLDESGIRWAFEVWDVVDRERLAYMPLEAAIAAQNVAFSPDGAQLITTNGSGESTVWDTETFEPIAYAQVSHGDFTRGAADPVRPEFATVGEDGILHIWRRDTGEEVLTFPTGGFTGRVEYSHDGRYLIVGTPDGYAVYVRDVHELADVARARLTRGFTDAECLRYLHQATCPTD